MRFLYIVIALSLFVPWNMANAKNKNDVVYQKGRYKVHKVMGVCKLEITLSKNDQDYQAILALFASDDYYNELFTERKRIGLATRRVLVGFDKHKAKRIPFVAEANAKDSYWHWQYLQESQDMLTLVKKRKSMQVKFSTNKKTFTFDVPLKGSSKAVTALRNCR